ncbi:hypothetical protein KY289_031018 [Solanum tuberosum]|nr:hypothetical protein KY284_031775 [Solanum tuberosum]KAH0653340.1 hypothetical protein KY289_031018 [Solanum tuberosum]
MPDPSLAPQGAVPRVEPDYAKHYIASKSKQHLMLDGSDGFSDTLKLLKPILQAHKEGAMRVVYHIGFYRVCLDS